MSFGPIDRAELLVDLLTGLAAVFAAGVFTAVIVGWLVGRRRPPS